MAQTIQKCRLCLESEKLLVTSINDGKFRTRLDAVSNVTFKHNEQWPTEVCSECSEKIDQFYSFMERVRCNQEQLQLSLPSIEIKKETSPEPSDEQFEDTDTKEELPEVEMAMPVEVEMYEEDTLAEEKNKDKEVNADLPKEDDQDDGKQVEVSEEDRSIAEFFPLNCDTCPKSFGTYQELKAHAKKAHDKQPVVQCCGKRFKYKYEMLLHINTHLKPFKCDGCGKGFAEKQTLNTHYSAKHMSSDEKPFKCDKCTRSFPTEQKLKTHSRYHDSVECPICQKTITNTYLLKMHINTMHTDDAKKFMCDVCGKEFRTQGAYQSHKIVHKELKREDGAQCEICHVWISRKQHLKKHMVQIHQSKEVTCDVCFKVFPNQKAFSMHKKLVHAEGKLECEFCGKRFHRNKNLQEHRAGHTGQKLYSCEFCGMEMNSNGNLYMHRKNKHPVEWMQAKQAKSSQFND